MAALGAWSYGAAALAFLGLTALLAVAWEGRGQGIRLIAATAATALWAGALALFGLQETAPPVLIFVAETLRNAAWLVVLAGLLETGGLPRWLARISYAAWLLALAAGLALAMSLRPEFTQLALGSGLLLPFLGLLMIEQVYRNSNTSGRWALKFFCVGLGGMLIYDLFLYSQGLLLGGIGADAWFARGFVFALAVPFLAIAARRIPRWSVKVFVSRDVAFYTTSFLAVGGYLLLMAAGGYVVKAMGGTWGGVLQLVFLAASFGILAVLVGSSALRRQVKVFLVKHFYHHKYEYREEWLRFIETLSAGAAGEDARQTSIRAVAQIIGSPAAVLLMLEDGRRSARVAATWPAEQAAPTGLQGLGGNEQLLLLLRDREWVIDLSEYRDNPEAYEHLKLPDELVARREWRLILPVLLRDRLLGMLLLKDPPANFKLTFEDRDLLKTVARHVATHLAQHESEQRLADARQFEAYSKLAAFLMHDLKNAVAQLRLVVRNAGQHRGNPEFIDDAVSTVSGTAERIHRLVEQLQQGADSDQPGPVALDELLETVARRGSGREPAPTLAIEAQGAVVRANRERLASVLEHLVRNAQEATPPGGRVELGLSVVNGAASVEVRDTGAGMSEEFVRDRLFRPFDSTKGSKGMGIGAYQAREYARSLGGDVEVESRPEKGTTFRILLPMGNADG